jgi:hypothetical protein
MLSSRRRAIQSRADACRIYPNVRCLLADHGRRTVEWYYAPQR